jgi:hypothetical protein
MIFYEPYSAGHLFGIRYRFTCKGDAIPAHAHDPDMLHNIIVLSGCIRFCSDAENRELFTGTVFDFDGSRAHRIECIEPNSQILNLLLRGRPAAYANVSDTDLKGSIET